LELVARQGKELCGDTLPSFGSVIWAFRHHLFTLFVTFVLARPGSVLVHLCDFRASRWGGHWAGRGRSNCLPLHPLGVPCPSGPGLPFQGELSFARFFFAKM